MSAGKRIARNTMFLLIAEAISKIFSFLIIISMTRHFGDTGFGKYSFALAYFMLFAIFADFGLSTYTLREISRNKHKAQKYVANSLALSILFSMILLIIGTGALLIMGRSQEIVLIVALVGIQMVISNAMQPFRMLFNAFERLEFYAAISAIERIAAVGLSFLFITRGYGLAQFLTAFIISQTLSFLASFIITKRYFFPVKLDFDLSFWKRMLVLSAPFWFTAVFMFIYARLDTLLLTYFRGYAAVGWYSAAYRIVEAFSFIPYIFIGAVFPSLSQFHASSSKELNGLFQACFKYLFIIGLPIGIGITLLADKIVGFFYAPEFSQAALVLKILIWGEFIIFFYYLFGYMLNAIDKQQFFAISTAITLALSVAFYILLIPAYGLHGAAIGMVLTYISAAVILSQFLRREGYAVNLGDALPKPLLAGAAMAGLLSLLTTIHFIAAGILAAMLYVLVIIATGAVGRAELELVKTLIPTKKDNNIREHGKV